MMREEQCGFVRGMQLEENVIVLCMEIEEAKTKFICGSVRLAKSL